MNMYAYIYKDLDEPVCLSSVFYSILVYSIYLLLYRVDYFLYNRYFISDLKLPILKYNVNNFCS